MFERIVDNKKELALKKLAKVHRECLRQQFATCKLNSHLKSFNCERKGMQLRHALEKVPARTLRGGLRLLDPNRLKKALMAFNRAAKTPVRASLKRWQKAANAIRERLLGLARAYHKRTLRSFLHWKLSDQHTQILEERRRGSLMQRRRSAECPGQTGAAADA